MKLFWYTKSKEYFLSPPSRAAWIETKTGKRPCLDMRSPPSRAAWIETILKVAEEAKT